MNICASIPDDRDYMFQALPGPFPAKLDAIPDIHVVKVKDQTVFGECTGEGLRPEARG